MQDTICSIIYKNHVRVKVVLHSWWELDMHLSSGKLFWNRLPFFLQSTKKTWAFLQPRTLVRIMGHCCRFMVAHFLFNSLLLLDFDYQISDMDNKLRSLKADATSKVETERQSRYCPCVLRHRTDFRKGNGQAHGHCLKFTRFVKLKLHQAYVESYCNHFKN